MPFAASPLDPCKAHLVLDVLLFSPTMNHRILRHTTLLLAALAIPAMSFAEAPKKKAPTKKPAAPAAVQTKGLGLKDGDRFLFIGDSITHQSLYTQFVEDFFYTRYPHIRLHFRNAGVSGDRAADALDRFEPDIAAFKPTVATILLGMNDGTYKDFDAETFATYEQGMTELLDQLDAIHCRVVLMSPTMFDHQAFEQMVAKDPARARGKVPTNYNAVLAYYGKWAQEVARKRGYLFVDLFGPLNTLTQQQRKTDPDFTLIEDAIHPGTDGQLVMAYSLLQQVGETGAIFSTGVRVKDGEWTPTSAALVSNISGAAGRNASYTVNARALPWTIFEAAPIGARLTRAGHTGSQESHVAVGLDAGKYDLVINGQTVGTYDEKQLGVHAEIEADKDSPTYQQAMKIIALNKQRNDEAVHPLRDLYSKRKGQLRATRGKGDAALAAFKTWEETEFTPKATELEKKAADFEAEIYKINQVQPLKVEIKPAS